MVGLWKETILPQTGASRRQIWAWAGLDFANSGYTTVVLTAVFNAYFVSVVAGGSPNATLAWTLLLGLSHLLVMVLAPWVGAYVDARGGRRRGLVLCTVVCATATAGLAWVGPGDWAMAGVLLLLSNFFFATHQDLSAAYLRELAPPDRLGRLSGFGWSVGYLGGLATLAMALAWVMAGPKEILDMPPAQVQMSGAMWVTAAVFLVVGLVALSQLPETGAATEASWQQAWSRLIRGWREMGEHRALRSFLGCVLVYQSGVATVIALASIYAQQALGFGMAQTIVLLLVVNVTASLGAFLFGRLQDWLGHRRSLSMALVLWMLMVVVAATAQGEAAFWVAANLAGLAMGASQSGARAVVGLLAPAGSLSEAFGYWGVAINAAAILGPLSYGLVTSISAGDHRLALWMTGLFFLAGWVWLQRLSLDPSRNERIEGQ